ncbi:flavin reductase RutF in pyrimidine catabolism pathway [Klebsiella oxytoca]|nr:flavin reductase RutF in pyrimidine catabolism pathway [Klebsiella oxytoca]
MSLADKQSFRDAMAHVGAAVNIITTDGPAGRAGFTASAVCSVTDAPPHAAGLPESFSLSMADLQPASGAVR